MSKSSVNIISKNGYLFAKRNHIEANQPYIANSVTGNSKQKVEFFNSLADNLPKKVIKVKTDPKHYSRYKHFQSLPKFAMDQPCINNASPYVGSQIQVLYKKEQESKKKWLAKDFNTQGKSLQQEKFSDKYYVTADPSEPPQLMKFRSDDRKTFLAGNFKH